TTVEAIGYGQLIDRALAVAARLTKHGVEPGQRCGLRMRQGPDFIVSALGILAAGLCMVPIADEYEGEVLDRFAAGTQLHYLLTGEELCSWPARRIAE